MKLAALGLAALLASPSVGGAALAQPMPPPGASPGIPSDQAVDPAPGATRPYLGHPGAFYDPVQRLQSLDARAAALPPAQMRRVRSDLRAIHAFADTQRQRHGGELRDWDREHMNALMNDLVARFPQLRG